MPSAAASQRSALSRIIGTVLKSLRRGAAASLVLRSRRFRAAAGASVASMAACAEPPAMRLVAINPAPSPLSAPRRSVSYGMMWFPPRLIYGSRIVMADEIGAHLTGHPPWERYLMVLLSAGHEHSQIDSLFL